MLTCRHCAAPLGDPFLDLGRAPFSNAYRTVEQRSLPEVHYPLRLLVCTSCWLVQTEDFARAADLFDDEYAYFSSVSESWLAHARNYADAMRTRLALDASSFVIEVASNDGYLLRNFVSAGIPCLGIEPTASTAAAAEAAGVPVLREFFGHALAQRLAGNGRRADLVIGNNVLAHVPDVNDFVAGMAGVLKPGGTITLEFPHLLRFIADAQFDTAYHEHFSYFSLYTVERILARAGLRAYDVDVLATHGGSLRVYACHQDDVRPRARAVALVLEEEASGGLQTMRPYREFQCRADRVKDDLVGFLIDRKGAGKVVAGYGAAAKGNTLLNYGGVKPDLMPFVCDAAPSKQGKYLPGSGIPILAPAALAERQPDYVLILPWNIADEVLRQQGALRQRGTRFVVALPSLREIGS